MKNLNFLIIESQNNFDSLESIIKQYEPFILNCASEVTHKYVCKSDDEWSIALMAFHESMKEYDLCKGNFLNFAKLVIKRRLIDYLSTQYKYKNEIIVDPVVFHTEITDNEFEQAISFELLKKNSQQFSDSISLEISTVNAIFSAYGFSFFELTSCSPHAKKTKTACANAVNYVRYHPLILSELHMTKHLPIKIIQKNTKVPRKLLERHRKYIIAAVEILSGEYPLLAEYLHFIREEDIKL